MGVIGVGVNAQCMAGCCKVVHGGPGESPQSGKGMAALGLLILVLDPKVHGGCISKQGMRETCSSIR